MLKETYGYLVSIVMYGKPENTAEKLANADFNNVNQKSTRINT
jgi:hypothetical protein